MISRQDLTEADRIATCGQNDLRAEQTLTWPEGGQGKLVKGADQEASLVWRWLAQGGGGGGGVSSSSPTVSESTGMSLPAVSFLMILEIHITF